MRSVTNMCLRNSWFIPMKVTASSIPGTVRTWCCGRSTGLPVICLLLPRSPMLPIRIRGSLFEERSRRDNRGMTTGQADRSASSLLQARGGPVLIHFSLGVFERVFRRPAACKRIPSGAVVWADFTRRGPTYGLWSGCYYSILLTYSDRPFRGSTKRGGEDSCGGF